MPKKEEILNNKIATLYHKVESGKILLDDITDFLKKNSIDDINRSYRLTKTSGASSYTILDFFLTHLPKQENTEEALKIVEFLVRKGADINQKKLIFTDNVKTISKHYFIPISSFQFIISSLTKTPIFEQAFRVVLEHTPMKLDFTEVIQVSNESMSVFELLCRNGTLNALNILITNLKRDTNLIVINLFEKNKKVMILAKKLEKFIVKFSAPVIESIIELLNSQSQIKLFAEELLVTSIREKNIFLFQYLFSPPFKKWIVFDIYVKNDLLLDLVLQSTPEFLNALYEVAVSNYWKSDSSTEALLTEFKNKVVTQKQHCDFLEAIIPILKEDDTNQLSNFLKQHESEFGKSTVQMFLESIPPFQDMSIAHNIIKSSSNLEVIRYLLDYPIDINNQDVKTRFTPFFAAMKQTPEIIELFFKYRPNILVTSIKEVPFILMAMLNGCTAFLSKLLEHQIDFFTAFNSLKMPILLQFVTCAKENEQDITTMAWLLSHAPIKERSAAIQFTIDKKKEFLLKIYFLDNANGYIELLIQPLNQRSAQSIKGYENSWLPVVSIENFTEFSASVHLNYLFYFSSIQINKTVLKYLFSSQSLNFCSNILHYPEQEPSNHENNKETIAYIRALQSIPIFKIWCEIESVWVIKKYLSFPLTQSQRLITLQTVTKLPADSMIRKMVLARLMPNNSSSNHLPSMVEHDSPTIASDLNPSNCSARKYLETLGFNIDKLREENKKNLETNNTISLFFERAECHATWLKGQIPQSEVVTVEKSQKHFYYLPLSRNYLSENFSESIAKSFLQKSRIRQALTVQDEGLVPLNGKSVIDFHLLINNELYVCKPSHKFKSLDTKERLVFVAIPSDQDQHQGKLLIPVHLVLSQWHDRFYEKLNECAAQSHLKPIVIDTNQFSIETNEMEPDTDRFSKLTC